MNRGRRYSQTPMARKRGRLQPMLVCVFAAGLTLSLLGLTAYFIQSAHNRADQSELAAEHQAAESQEQAASADTHTDATLPTPSPAQSAASPRESGPSASAVPFFQVIGLTRKAFKPLAARNEDAVGWISIEGLVDQPIVYRNNTFYLDHDFDRRRNVSGAVFLDEGHPLRADSQNLLLYGHNMKDESMFGPLLKYMQNNFLRTHFRVTFETRFETFTYLIFAVDRVSMDTKSPQFLYFWGHPAFADAQEMQVYIDEVYQKSLYTHFLNIDETDTLLTLVTCVGEDRLALFARRQRANETEADIQAALLSLTMR